MELLGGELGGKFWPPRGLSPKRRCPRPGRFSKPLPEPPFRLRGAWDFGGLRPDLSLASEPAWRVRWLVRLGRPGARLGGSAPATGTSATGRATDSVGSFASVGPGGAERGSGGSAPATGTSATGQATDHLSSSPRARLGTPWECDWSIPGKAWTNQGGARRATTWLEPLRIRTRLQPRIKNRGFPRGAKFKRIPLARSRWLS